jgi:hypothetical protein
MTATDPIAVSSRRFIATTPGRAGPRQNGAMSAPSLNQAQRAVLRWVADGSPDDIMEGYSYRISAAAVRSRGLVGRLGVLR